MLMVMHAVTIGQREHGFVAPNKDRDGVDKLVTGGMSTCFALSLLDRSHQVGLLAHVDNLTDFRLGFFAKKVSFRLKELGATDLSIETVNLWSNPMRVLYMYLVTAALKQNGLGVVRHSPESQFSKP